MYKDDNHSAIENLSSELLIHILLLLGDPLYISCLARTSKTLQKKLMDANQRMYWFTLYQRDFAKNPKPLSPEKETAYKNLYIKSLEDWRTSSHLSKKHQKLFRCIRADDLPSIEQQTYDLSSGNDFMDFFDQEDNAVSLASRYKRDDILAYFYEQMCTHVFSKNKQDNKGRTKLSWATACNRLSEVNMLTGEDVNKAQDNTLFHLYITTLLYIAAQNGHLEIVETLLNKGADVNNKALNDNTTSLLIAIFHGHLEMVEAIDAAKADVNKALNENTTPLYIAAQRGHLEVVKTLLDAGADVNTAKLSGATSLSIAAQNGHLEVVKTLLAARADVNKICIDTTPLHIAAQNGHLEMVKTLLAAEADVNNAKTGGATPLYIAAQQGHLEIVKTLLAAGADVNKPCNGRATPLYIAARNGHLKVVKTLLTAEADVDKAMLSDTTSLHIAARNGHLEMVKTLLAAGADVDKAKLSGATPLYIAAQDGHLEVVKTLLAAGADVDKPCTGRATSLYIAAQNGHLEIVKTLLAAGADVNKPCNGRATPLYIAARNGHQKIYSFLKFWKTKNLCKETPLLKQIILFLEISIQEKSLFDIFKTSFFSKKDDLHVLINKLKKGELELNKKDLKLILEENRDCIPLEKYEFILSYILADDPLSNTVSQMDMLYPKP